MKAKLVILAVLSFASAQKLSAQVWKQPPPKYSCPSGYIRVETKWEGRDKRLQTGCVRVTLTTRNLLSNGNCPQGYWQTYVTGAPHNIICVLRGARLIGECPQTVLPASEKGCIWACDEGQWRQGNCRDDDVGTSPSATSQGEQQAEQIRKMTGLISVPPPGPLTRTYRAQSISFRYPDNWQVGSSSSRQSAVIYPSEASIRLADGRNFYTHGVFFGFTQSSEQSDQSVAEQLLAQMRRSQPSVEKTGDLERSAGGVRARGIAYFSANAASPLGAERGIILTVREVHGVHYWVMFAPESEFRQYAPVFSQIFQTLQVEQESAPEVQDHSSHRDVVARIETKLRNNRQFQVPPFRIIVQDSEQINAYAYAQKNVIVLPTGIVHFLEGNEGELAAVIAHELGHIYDKNCQQIAPSYAVTSEGQSRFCERRADEFGMQYLMGAGYSPYEMAGCFGKLMMFSGQDSTVLGSLLGRILNDHPVNMDRINDLRKLLIQICANNPGSCR